MSSTKLFVVLLATAAAAAACGSSENNVTPDAGVARCDPPAPGTAPTYTELYTKYFAVGKPGHCATEGCHGQTDFNTWKCGNDKTTCFTGMATMAGLINLSNPTASPIGDTRRSPLIWVNPGGFMPQDALTPFNEGRDAILAWVAACAQNN
jgi:hypothetical protein